MPTSHYNLKHLVKITVIPEHESRHYKWFEKKTIFFGLITLRAEGLYETGGFGRYAVCKITESDLPEGVSFINKKVIQCPVVRLTFTDNHQVRYGFKTTAEANEDAQKLIDQVGGKTFTNGFITAEHDD